MNNAVFHGRLEDAFIGVLLGTAVGDSLGLPAEGMSRERIRRRWHGQWRQRFIFGWGMTSDDTEHTLFVAQALLTYPDDVAAFQRCLAQKLRFWLLGVPAGIGLATLKSTLKLWMGCPANRSGTRSAGNGPAMRSAILGAYFADDLEVRRRFVVAATRLTHTDPRAETAALAVAEAVAWTILQRASHKEWLVELQTLDASSEWQSICQKMTQGIFAGMTVAEFAESLGLQKGVTGYAYHSVPIALYAWLRHPEDFRAALESSLDCGGDTDTVGAMVGAMCGAKGGKRSIPSEWLAGFLDWPRSRSILEKVAGRLAQQKLTSQSQGPVIYFWPGLILRNLVFLITVLAHAFRRFLPPY